MHTSLSREVRSLEQRHAHHYPDRALRVTTGLGLQMSLKTTAEAEVIVTKPAPQARISIQEEVCHQKAPRLVGVHRCTTVLQHRLASKLLLERWNAKLRFHGHGKGAMTLG